MTQLLSDNPFLIPSFSCDLCNWSLQAADYYGTCVSSITVGSKVKTSPIPALALISLDFLYTDSEGFLWDLLCPYITIQSLYQLTFGFHGTT